MTTFQITEICEYLTVKEKPLDLQHGHSMTYDNKTLTLLILNLIYYVVQGTI